MKLEQSFEVEAPLERVWEALVDVERVAPCLPGAAVTGRNDDGTYNGTFTIKIGPTTASYTGKLEMQDIDESAHSATMHAQGSDKRGQGGATATIVSKLTTGDTGTRVEVVTDYHITGRLARFGRGGMIEDISERLLREFAGRLQSSLAGGGAAGGPAPGDTGAGDTAAGDTDAGGTGAGGPAAGGTEPAPPPPPTEVAVEPPQPEPKPEPAPAPGPAPEPEPGPSVPPAESESAGESEAPVTPSPPPDEAESPRARRSPSAAKPAAGPPPPPPAPPSEPTRPPAPPAPAEPPQPAEQTEAEVAPPPPPPPKEAAPPPPPPSPPPPPPPPPQERPSVEPAPPIQGVSLVGSVLVERVKRNPKPLVAAAGGLVLLRLLRRRR